MALSKPSARIATPRRQLRVVAAAQKINPKRPGFASPVKVTRLGKRKWELDEDEEFCLGNDARAEALGQPFLTHLGARSVRRGADGYWTIRVPGGFWFDLASIPRPAWIIVAPQELIRSAMIHDWLYDLIICSDLDRSKDEEKIWELKKAADSVFQMCMEYENDFGGDVVPGQGYNVRFKDASLHEQWEVSWLKKFLAYQAVNLFGGRKTLFRHRSEVPNFPRPEGHAMEGEDEVYKCGLQVPILPDS